MRILIVSRSVPDANHPLSGIFEWDQAKALAARGHEVTVASLDMRPQADSRPFARDGVTVYAAARPMAALVKRIFRAGKRLLHKDGQGQKLTNLSPDAAPKKMYDRMQTSALLRLYPRILKEKGAPDIVHAHFLEQAAAASALCERERLPLVITEHLSLLNRPDVPSALRARACFNYRQADKLLAVSEAFRVRLHELTQYPVDVMPNMVDTDVFSGGTAPHPADAPFRFVSCGNLIPGKAFERLIDAFARAHRTTPGSTLTVFGEGECRAALEAQVARLGLSDSVSLPGFCPRQQLADEYRAADAFVLASRGETFGVAYVEAMAAGLPVIAARCGGPEDFVTEETGLLVPVDDTDALADAMTALCRSRDRYDRGKIAAVARERFCPRRIAERLTQLYAEVLDTYRIPAPPAAAEPGAEPLVSIIMPVYNTAPYLGKCLDSLLTQTYRNIEIVAVDDGSTDGSGTVLDAAAAKDARLRVFHQANGGVSAARNFALTQVCGAYVTFMDSDDYLEPDLIETLLCTALSTQSDVIESGCCLRYEDGRADARVLPVGQTVESRVSCLRASVRTVESTQSVWGKLYRREVLDGVCFPATRYGEDYLFNIRAHAACRRITVLPYAGYYYIQRSGSCCGSPFSEKTMDYARSVSIAGGEIPPSMFRYTACQQVIHALRYYWQTAGSDLPDKPHWLQKQKEVFYAYLPRIYGQAKKDFRNSRWYLPSLLFRVCPRLFLAALKIIKKAGLLHL